MVVPRGRLNMVAARQLRETLTGLVDGGTSRIVVDLARDHVPRLLRASARWSPGSRPPGRRAATCASRGRTESVLTVFKLTNMDKVLRPRDDVEGAFHG